MSWRCPPSPPRDQLLDPPHLVVGVGLKETGISNTEAYLATFRPYRGNMEAYVHRGHGMGDPLVVHPVYVSQEDSLSQLDIKGDIDGVVVELGALAHLRAP